MTATGGLLRNPGPFRRLFTTDIPPVPPSNGSSDFRAGRKITKSTKNGKYLVEFHSVPPGADVQLYSRWDLNGRDPTKAAGGNYIGKTPVQTQIGFGSYVAVVTFGESQVVLEFNPGFDSE